MLLLVFLPQSLNRLETASFTIEKVIDAGTTGNKLQQFLVGQFQPLGVALGEVAPARLRGGTITRANWPRCMIARMHKKFKPVFSSARAVTPDRRVVNCGSALILMVRGMQEPG